MVCYRRPPSSPHIHSARTAQDGSRKRYSHTSIKNHATVSQAALSNFDRRLRNAKSRLINGSRKRADERLKESVCVSLLSRLRHRIFKLPLFFPLRRTRLSDWFLTRFVRLRVISRYCVSFFFFLFLLKLKHALIIFLLLERWRKRGKN